MLNWLSHHDFRVAENGEQLEISAQEPNAKAGVRNIRQNFVRSSAGMNDSMSSVKQMIYNFEKNAPTRRNDSVRERIRRFSVRDEPVKVELSRRSSFVVPSVREHLGDDEVINSNVESRKNFVPMAERIQEYEEERNDELVLSNLTDVVRSRRVMFSSPNSTLECPPPTKKQVGNGSVAKHVTIRLDNPPRKTNKPDELRRRIEEIEREIRENEKRLKAIPDVMECTMNRSRPLKACRKVTKSDSLLSRLKPKSAVAEPPSVRKANIIRQLGLPLDENHNLESYLSQFSLEGEFV